MSHDVADWLYDRTYYVWGYWNEITDKRTAHYPLVSRHPITIGLIMTLYYFIMTKWGPALMKNRKPFQLRRTMFIYNVTMVFINGYYFFQAVYRSDYFRRLFQFEYPDRSDVRPETLYEIDLGFWYWMSKFADWFDTALYVLRKKESHINFLHMYHHISVPTFGYLIMKINPVLPAAHLFIVVNTFVHCCMYSYYALAAMGPQVQKYLWWKRYITIMQLGQFAIGMAYGVLVFFFQTGYPPVWLYFGFTQPPFFFWMFYNFYRQTYRSGQKRSVNSGLAKSSLPESEQNQHLKAQ